MADPNVQVVERQGFKIAKLVHLAEFNLFSMNTIKKKLNDAIADKPEKFIIDLSEVEYIDSSGIGALIAIRRTIAAYKGDFYITGLNPSVSQVFAHTKLDQLFQIMNTVEDAMGS